MTNLDALLGRLDTEVSRPDLADLDTRPVEELVRLFAREDAAVPVAVAAAGAAIAAAVQAVGDRLASGGRLVYVGAGTPGRLAVLDAAELRPTFGVGPDTVVAVMAGGSSAMTSAVEGAEDDEDAGRRDLAAVGVGPGDAVVGITASGRTPYVLGAVDAARARGAVTIGVCNNAGSVLSDHVDHPIEVLTGPEVVAGSTRLKAGTSQKLVLNTLSTLVMIRLGKVHGNLMVDLVATNDKLRRRAHRIVAEVTGAGEAEVGAALESADGHVRTAIVALLAGTDAVAARVRLDRAGGRVRAALNPGGDL